MNLAMNGTVLCWLTVPWEKSIRALSSKSCSGAHSWLFPWALLERNFGFLCQGRECVHVSDAWMGCQFGFLLFWSVTASASQKTPSPIENELINLTKEAKNRMGMEHEPIDSPHRLMGNACWLGIVEKPAPSCTCTVDNSWKALVPRIVCQTSFMSTEFTWKIKKLFALKQAVCLWLWEKRRMEGGKKDERTGNCVSHYVVSLLRILTYSLCSAHMNKVN